MEINRVSIVYFSGTGGSERVAACFRKTFADTGIQTELQEIKRGKDLPNGEEDLLVLVFAVHAANAPEIVYKWLNGMKTVRGRDAAVISVSAGGEVTPNKACRVGCIRRLMRKGYRVVYEDTVVMPSNILVATPEEVSLRLFRVLPVKVGAIAEDILSGRVKRAKIGPVNRFLSFVMKAEQPGARIYGRKYHADGQCNGCGWCSRKCPAGNIRMEGGRPVFKKQCLMCLGCVYGCPERAIHPKTFKSFLLKEGFDIADIEKKAAQAGQRPDAQLPESILWKGVCKYLNGIDKDIKA